MLRAPTRPTAVHVEMHDNCFKMVGCYQIFSIARDEGDIELWSSKLPATHLSPHCSSKKEAFTPATDQKQPMTMTFKVCELWT
jgi:hypothetical protein